MKKHLTIAVVLVLIVSLSLVSCTSGTEDVPTETKAVSENTQSPSSEPESTPTPEPTPEPEEGVTEISLQVNSGGSSNTMYSASHYGLHITYTDEYIVVMNYLELMLHGEDRDTTPEPIEGFEYQAEDLRFYNGMLYFLLYDYGNDVYHLYSYDFENEPVKISQETVYHYEFMDGKIVFTKEFYQGPVYSMNPDGSGLEQLTEMRSHSFVQDNGLIYFYSTDAGTAPGLVRYNPMTGGEETIIFPFYSHNYLVYDGYVYYVLDSTYRSIHRMNLSDQTVEDLWVEMTDYTISLNVSDNTLYILAGNTVYESSLDGSSRKSLFEADDSLQTGLYVFGNRIYTTDGTNIYMLDKETGNKYTYPMQ